MRELARSPAQSLTAQGISAKSYERLVGWFHERSGIYLKPEKRTMVVGRLLKRVLHLGLADVDAYVELVVSGRDRAESSTAVDILTTNETYFFREPKHFEHLRQTAQAMASAGVSSVRVWSAACSTGEEPYSAAMVLSEVLPADVIWSVLATDLSSRVVRIGHSGIYPRERTVGVDERLFSRYFKRGLEEYAGFVRVSKALRSRLHFAEHSLMEPLSVDGRFDFVFLRNVLIYFDHSAKVKIVKQILPKIKKGGFLYIGHSESLKSICDELTMVSPNIYQKNF